MRLGRKADHRGQFGDDPWNRTPRSDYTEGRAFTEPNRPRDRRSLSREKQKTAAIVILAVILLVVVSGAVTLFAALVSDGSFTENRTPELPGNFEDYFSEYYDDTSGTGENSIDRTDPNPAVSMKLLSENSGQLSMQDIYDKCIESIVAITSSVGGRDYSWGTGIVLSEDGYIITNSHVLEGADAATVTLFDDRPFKATLVGHDTLSDIAVIKIDCTGLKPAEFGNSSVLRAGDKVVAIGNPLGKEFRGTMTDGIVSAINRDIDFDGNYMTLIQTNAAINGGNSGGALIDMRGMVIGITNMKMISDYTSIEGIGFAIPTSTVKTVVDAIMQSGYVTGRPGIGVTVGPIPPEAAENYDLPYGVYVSIITPGSGAEAAGIQVGDIITKANGEPIRETADLNLKKSALGVGDELLLTVWRAGAELEISVELMDMSELFR